MRVDVTQTDVLELVVKHLREQLELNERTCWETIEPLAVQIPRGGPFFVTVAPGEGQFEPGEQAPRNITEEWSITVTGYTRPKVDSTDHDEKLLRDAARGLLVVKHKILKALVGEDIQNKNRDEFLRQLLYAQHSSRPQFDKEKGIGWISIDFGVEFDWDLVTE